MVKNKTAAAYIGMIMYAIIVGFSFIFVKTANAQASAAQVLTFRFALGILPHLCLLLCGKEKISLRAFGKPSLLLATLTYIGFLGFQALGLLYTTSIISGILFAMTPVFARLIAGVVLKEKTSWKQNLFMLLSVGSVIAMFVIGSADKLHGIDLRGFLLLVLSTFCCSVSNVFMRYVKKEHAPLQVSFYCCFAGLVVCGTLLTVLNTVNGTWSATLLPWTNSEFLSAILYLGILCTFVTTNLLSYSLHYLPAVNATIWGNVSTAISVVAGAILLQEPLLPYQIICTLLIIVGVLGISFSGTRQNQ